MTSFDPLIKFPCRCGHLFAVPADQAGLEIQCPKCGLLHDVPGLGDLENLSDDGTLLIRPASTAPDPKRTVDARRHFHRDRVDATGEEIDLRSRHEDLANVGAPLEIDLIPLSEQDSRPTKPKYDPETGELIRPMKLAPRPDLETPADIPVAARALNYAAGGIAYRVHPLRVLLELLFPSNMVVMLFVLLLHGLLQMTGIAMLAGLFLVAPAGVVLAILILAHYGNTIDETGPEERDELPRPIRGLSFSEDIWNPFCHMAGAMMICYLPAWAALRYGNLSAEANWAVFGLLGAVGTFFFPATALTLQTGSVLNNLRPDRVLGVIRIAGWHYLLSVVAWSVSLGLYVAGTISSLAMALRIFSGDTSLLGHPAVTYSLILLAIYASHFFSWHLGLIYRARHQDFPWVLQRHVSTRAKQELQEGAAVRQMRRKRSYVQPQGKPGE